MREDGDMRESGRKSRQRGGWTAAALLAAPTLHAQATVTAGTATGAGLVVAVALAFAGGLLLNLMPCVLPVLSMKVVGLLANASDRVKLRRCALAYTSGVLLTFAAVGCVIMALRATGHAFGWGAQLQQPLVVAVLACLMVAIGLSLSGVVHFGASLGNHGHALAAKSGWAGDFFTGVLAVVVASPCVAPFMGAALAYAFVAPVYFALPVFLALGLGLALPFLLIGLVPVLGRWLPRPGAWMETMKQVLAFPMYLTAAWLVWVLAHQRGADAVGLTLVAAITLAFTLWCFERSRQHGYVAKAVTVGAALLLAAPIYLIGRIGPSPAPVAPMVASTTATIVDYSPSRLAALRDAGTPVFVDMTADWCITCKANEHAVLDTAEFRKLLQQTGAVYMRGDWTNTNATITAFLQQYGSPGVPLYVVFPKGGGAGAVLPNVLTYSLIQHALLAAVH